MIKINVKDFTEKENKVLSGYENGKNFRTLLQLDRIEREESRVEIQFPSYLNFISMSFLKGMFENSVKVFTIEEFKKFYVFKGNKQLVKILESNIDFIY